MNPYEGQQAGRVAEEMSNAHFPLSLSLNLMKVWPLWCEIFFLFYSVYIYSIREHVSVCVYKCVQVGDTNMMNYVCAHALCVCVISVNQDDLDRFSCVMFIYCLVKGTLSLSFSLHTSLSLSPSYQNLLHGLLWKPRKEKKIQGYISSPWLSLLPLSGQTIDGLRASRQRSVSQCTEKTR